MIPFDLVQFDEDENVGGTAAAIEAIAMVYIGKAGLEREAAVLLLSRLYTRYVTFFLFYTFLKVWLTFPRKDAGEGFHKFIQWSHTLLREGHDVFTVSIQYNTVVAIIMFMLRPLAFWAFFVKL